MGFDDGPNYSADRDAAILWARDLLGRDDWGIFDSETTGLRGAEIVQVGLLSPAGEVLLDTLVHPHNGGIPAAATAIHGITDAMVADAPYLHAVLPQMQAHMHGKEVVVYNKGFDQGVLYGCLRRRSWPGVHSDLFADQWIGACRWTCAMEQYSKFAGEWNDYHGNYRWQKLPGAGHTAIGDCISTLAVIQQMAGSKTESEK